MVHCKGRDNKAAKHNVWLTRDLKLLRWKKIGRVRLGSTQTSTALIGWLGPYVMTLSQIFSCLAFPLEQ